MESHIAEEGMHRQRAKATEAGAPAPAFNAARMFS